MSKLLALIQPLWPLLIVLFLPWYIVRFQLGPIPFTALELVIYLGAVATICAKLLRKQSWSPPKSKLVWLGIAAWVVVFSLSLAISSELIAALGIYKAYLIAPLVAFFLIYDHICHYKYRYIVIGFALLIAQIAILAMSQAIFSWPNFAPHELAQGRASGTFNTANAIGLLLGPLVAASLVLFVRSIKPGFISANQRWFLGLVVALGSIAIVLSRSEGALIALVLAFAAAATTVLAVRYRRALMKKYAYHLAASAVIVYVLATIIFMAWINNPPTVANPYTRPDFTTMTVRQCVWEGTWASLTQSPLLGNGLASFTGAYLDNYTCDAEPLVYPHNLILNFWSELGFAGLVVAMAWIALMSGIGVRLLANKDIASQMAGVLAITASAYWLAHGLVDVPYFKNDLSVLWWIISAVVLVSYYHSSPKQVNSD